MASECRRGGEKERERKQVKKETKGRRFPVFHVVYNFKTCLPL